jgi:hypothetical protein
LKICLNFLTIIILPMLLSGCLSSKEQNYKFDYDTGAFEIDFHDIRSQKEADSKKDNVGEDWASVKQALAKKDDFDPAVVSVRSKKIFQEGDALSGTSIYQVQCPKCFPSRLDILKLLYDDGRWEENNNEIFLIVSNNIHLVSTNGTLVRTRKNTIGVWPSDTKSFEFDISEDNTGDVSLLNKYLSENKEKKI